MGFSEVDLQGYEVPTARSDADRREYYRCLCNKVEVERQTKEQMYVEFDILNQIGNGKKYVEPERHAVQSPIRGDWKSLEGEALEAEIKSVEKLYLWTVGERKELEKAINGLANVSEKMAV